MGSSVSARTTPRIASSGGGSKKNDPRKCHQIMRREGGYNYFLPYPRDTSRRKCSFQRTHYAYPLLRFPRILLAAPLLLSRRIYQKNIGTASPLCRRKICLG